VNTIKTALIKINNLKLLKFFILKEEETLKKLTQTPIIAPSVRQLNGLSKQIETTPILFNSSFSNPVKENAYLFENIDDSLLKTNEEYVNRIKNDIQVKKEISKKREQFNNSSLKLSLDKPVSIKLILSIYHKFYLNLKIFCFSF